MKTITALVLLGLAGIYLIATAERSDDETGDGGTAGAVVTDGGSAETPLLATSRSSPSLDEEAAARAEAQAEVRRQVERDAELQRTRAREAAARLQAENDAAEAAARRQRNRPQAQEVPLGAVPVGSEGPRVHPAAPEEQAGSSPTDNEALRRIDRWLRALPGDRPAAEAGMEPEVGAELKSFRRMLEGGAAGYAADLRLGLPEHLGREFAGYARTFSEQGIEGLHRQLGGATRLSPAAMAWTEALAATAMQQGSYQVAGSSLGRLLALMLDSGYDRERVLGHQGTVASLARRAASFLPSRDFKVPPGASMDPICRRLRREGLPINIGWLADFNDKRTSRGRHFNLREGETLEIPTTPLRSEIWRQQRVHVVYSGDVPVRLISVSVGKEGFETPLGRFTLKLFQPEPKWYQPDGPPIDYGKPENPLGERWIGFAEKPNYGLHGTNSDATIGGFESEGCVRHDNEVITDLFELLAPGGEVVIRP